MPCRSPAPLPQVYSSSAPSIPDRVAGFRATSVKGWGQIDGRFSPDSAFWRNLIAVLPAFSTLIRILRPPAGSRKSTYVLVADLVQSLGTLIVRPRLSTYCCTGISGVL